MKLYIAEMIAKRRRELNLTQEELASRIGVSSQAVSNWERKAGYPDVMLIPSLANALAISTDELFGVDKLSDNEILEQFKSDLRQIAKTAEQKKCIIKYYNQYPNVYCVLEWIIWIVYREFRDDVKMVELAKELGRRILNECTDTSCRLTAQKVLAFICEDKEAQKYIDTFDEQILIRPNIIGRRLWDKHYYRSAHDFFDLEMVLLFQYIFAKNSYCKDTPEHEIKWNELLIDLMKTIGNGDVPDGWLNSYGAIAIRLSAAYFANGNKEKGYEYLETALSIYQKWYSFPEGGKLSTGRLSIFDNVRFSINRYDIRVYIGDDPYENCNVQTTKMSTRLSDTSSYFDEVKTEGRFVKILNAAKELEKKYNID